MSTPTPAPHEDLTRALAKAIETVTDLAYKIAGDASEELGGLLRDHVKVYRLKRQLALWKRVQQYVKDAGFSPKAVDPKLLLTSIDAASVESDDDLQEMWAALIANAADPGCSSQVQTYFPELLRQLTKGQALLLSALKEDSDNQRPPEKSTTGVEIRLGSWTPPQILKIYMGLGLISNETGELMLRLEKAYSRTLEEQKKVHGEAVRFGTAIENLIRLGLLAPHTPTDYEIKDVIDGYEAFGRHITGFEDSNWYYMTITGRELVRACTKPKPSIQLSDA
jgi:hypothetical protein